MLAACGERQLTVELGAPLDVTANASSGLDTEYLGWADGVRIAKHTRFQRFERVTVRHRGVDVLALGPAKAMVSYVTRQVEKVEVHPEGVTVPTAQATAMAERWATTLLGQGWAAAESLAVTAGDLERCFTEAWRGGVDLSNPVVRLPTLSTQSGAELDVSLVCHRSQGTVELRLDASLPR